MFIGPILQNTSLFNHLRFSGFRTEHDDGVVTYGPKYSAKKIKRSIQGNDSKLKQKKPPRSLKQRLKRYTAVAGVSTMGVLGAVNLFPVNTIDNCVPTQSSENTNVTDELTLMLPIQETVLETEEALLSYLLQSPYQSGEDLSAGIGIVNALVLDKDQPHWTQEDIDVIQQKILAGELSEDVQRQLVIAGELDALLRENSSHGDDFHDLTTISRGFEVVIRANTMQTERGTYVCQHQLIDDLKLFFINHPPEPGVKGFIYKHINEYPESIAAKYLFAEDRIGSAGFHRKYWDGFDGVNAGNPSSNQAHHLAAFFIEGLRRDSRVDINAYIKSFGLDGGVFSAYNKGDMYLSAEGIRLGFAVRKGEISWQELPQILIERLSP